MRRVNVVGTSGSGKSTVAAALAAKLGVPHVELDALLWLPGWKERPVDDCRDRVAAAVSGDGWVVDGNYGDRARDLVWPRTDTIVWLDLPRSTVMRQVTWRTLSRWWSQEVLWGTNRESLRMTLLSRESILWWAWSTHARRRATFQRVLRDVPQRVVHLRTRREADAWLRSV
jgi:adenylate kinase family enzyme